MDLVTDAQVAVALTVPVARERMWELITAVDRIGEWSPEAIGGSWYDDGPAPGARFIGRNRLPDGSENMVNCVVIEAVRPSRYAWTVLDAAGLVGSTWRYELHAGDAPGSTTVHHSFTHGPGATGMREGAADDPRARERRLVDLCRNMTTTIVAMADAESSIGVAG